MRSFRKITALMMLAVMLAGAAACTGRSGMGASLGANIARVYTPADRTSRFMLNGAMLEGTVTGKAYFDDVEVAERELRPVDGLYSSVYRNEAAEGRVLAAACGSRKAEAIIACLRYEKHCALITDEGAARRMLSLIEAEGPLPTTVSAAPGPGK